MLPIIFSVYLSHSNVFFYYCPSDSNFQDNLEIILVVFCCHFTEVHLTYKALHI